MAYDTVTGQEFIPPITPQDLMRKALALKEMTKKNEPSKHDLKMDHWDDLIGELEEFLVEYHGLEPLT